MRQQRFDPGAEYLLIVLERCLAIAVVEYVGIDLHRLLLLTDTSNISGYFSVSLFRLARPISKSLPTMRSMFMNTCMIFPMNGVGPYMSQVRLVVTLVASPCGSIVNSAVLWPSNGAKKSSLMTIFVGTEVSRISMRPEPTFLLPSHAHTPPIPPSA